MKKLEKKDFNVMKPICPGMDERKFDLFTIMVEEHNSEIIGYAIISELAEYAAIEEFFILEKFRRKGKGKDFYQEIETYLKKNNFKYVKLLASNSVAKFWQKLGFIYLPRELCYNYIKST